MNEADAKQDPRVMAIRADAVVGNGTCTGIDECWDAHELVEALDRDHVLDPIQAVAWAREQEGLVVEQGLNARWGEDRDPQLQTYREFQQAKAEAEDQLRAAEPAPVQGDVCKHGHTRPCNICEFSAEFERVTIEREQFNARRRAWEAKQRGGR
jgi:hypothetical protein